MTVSRTVCVEMPQLASLSVDHGMLHKFGQGNHLIVDKYSCLVLYVLVAKSASLVEMR